MKTIVLLILCIILIDGCTIIELGNLKCVDTIEGGCFLKKGMSFKGDPLIDTLLYRAFSDSLDITVGFNANCCSEFNPSTSIKADSIVVKILTTNVGLCDCICYYTYDFKFSGAGNSYNYSFYVIIDDKLRWTGELKFPNW